MIPVLDFSRFTSGSDRDGFVADLGKACRETGFILITGHGIPEALIADTFAAADAFFDLPAERKAPLDILKVGSNRGWAAEGSENLDDTSGQIDLKEGFNIGLEMAADDPRILAGEPFRAVNAWPEVPGFRETALSYFDAVHRLGVELHRAIALDLGLEEHYFAPFFDQPLATLRFLRYPAGRREGEAIGAGAHTDYGSVTLLLTDDGLAACRSNRSGKRLDGRAAHVPGAYVVNIGDCLMRWSNDIYVSTPHRVLPPAAACAGRSPFFLDPEPRQR